MLIYKTINMEVKDNILLPFCNYLRDHNYSNKHDAYHILTKMFRWQAVPKKQAEINKITAAFVGKYFVKLAVTLNTVVAR